MSYYLQKISKSVLLAITLFAFVNCGAQNPRSQASERDGESWIGLHVQDVDRELVRYLDLDENEGALVNRVVDDSPADRAGLRKEDVIIRFGGKRIRDTEDLSRLLKRKQPGERVELEIIRDGKKRKLDLRIGEKPESYYTFKTPQPPVPPVAPVPFQRQKSWLGVKTAEINRDLADYFDVRPGEGVLVLSVAEDSPAERAGLRAGDVIVAVAGERVRDSEDLVRELRNYEPGEEIEIGYIRKGDNRKSRVELARRTFDSSFHFDKDAWKEWQKSMREWGEEMKEWKANLNLEELENLKTEIEINIPVRELERELESMGEEIGREMEKLSRELEKMEFEIKVHVPGESI